MLTSTVGSSFNVWRALPLLQGIHVFELTRYNLKSIFFHSRTNLKQVDVSNFCLPPEGQEVLNLGVLLVVVGGINSFLLLFEKT